MITRDEYFIWQGKEKPHSAEIEASAEEMLLRVNTMLQALGWEYYVCPNTNSPISGSHAGHGDGGFRLPDTTTGAAHSKHRIGRAVDVYDPNNELDEMLTDELLAQYGLYREHPDSTPHWCHLQDVAPGSGHRTFQP